MAKKSHALPILPTAIHARKRIFIQHRKRLRQRCCCGILETNRYCVSEEASCALVHRDLGDTTKATESPLEAPQGVRELMDGWGLTRGGSAGA
jgi:hypothetical protein